MAGLEKDIEKVIQVVHDFLNKFKLEPLDFKANETTMLFCLFIIYCINHGWIFLISGALFWDDWTL